LYTLSLASILYSPFTNYEGVYNPDRPQTPGRWQEHLTYEQITRSPYSHNTVPSKARHLGIELIDMTPSTSFFIPCLLTSMPVAKDMLNAERTAEKAQKQFNAKKKAPIRTKKEERTLPSRVNQHSSSMSSPSSSCSSERNDTADILFLAV
jgi:hypothetical protein